MTLGVQASEISLVITTLILATTFTPIKGRLEDLVDRRMKPVDDEAPGETHGQATLRHELFSDPAFIAELDRPIRTTFGKRRRGDGGD